MSHPSGPVVGWFCLMRDPTPSQWKAGRQWSGSPLAPLWADVLLNTSRASKAAGTSGSPVTISSHPHLG